MLLFPILEGTPITIWVAYKDQILQMMFLIADAPSKGKKIRILFPSFDPVLDVPLWCPLANTGNSLLQPTNFELEFWFILGVQLLHAGFIAVSRANHC